MNPNELCICTHPLSDHSGNGCSAVFSTTGTLCPCKEFAMLDAGVDIFEALKLVLAELKQRVAETGVERHIFEIKKAENALRKAKGENA